VFDGYKRPTLITNSSQLSDGNPLHKINTTDAGKDAFYQRIEELNKAVREGRVVPYNLIFSDYQVSDCDVCYFSEGGASHANDQINVTRRTTTEHLQPIVDGKIEDRVLTFFRDGKEIYRGYTS